MAHPQVATIYGKFKVTTACVSFGAFYGAVCGALGGSVLQAGIGSLQGAVGGGILGAIGGGVAGVIGTVTGGPHGWCLAGAVGAVTPGAVLLAREMTGEPFFLGLLLGGLALLGGALGYAVGARPGHARCSLPGVQPLAHLIQDMPLGPLSETSWYSAEVLPAVAPEGRGDEAAPVHRTSSTGNALPGEALDDGRAGFQP